jgi:hypothetical protein
MKAIFMYAISVILTIDLFACNCENLKFTTEKKLNLVNFMIDECYINGNYNINFDYHMGYLNGKRHAYNDIMEILED